MLPDIERFVTSKLAQNCSLRTVEWYEWLLTRYDTWCESHAKPLLSPDSIERFLAHLRREGQAASTLDAYYRALRVYCNWLVQRRILPPADNPFAVLDQPKLPKRRPRHVSLEHFSLLYNSVDTRDWTGARDRAILILLFYSGLRVGELLALREPDLQLTRGLVLVRAGKGGDDRQVPCAPALAAEMTDYLRLRPAYKSNVLWLSNNGSNGVRGPLTMEGVRQMLRRRCKDANVPYLSPHKYRHGFAMALLNAGMEMSALSAAMGHNSVKTTEHTYARWVDKGLQREYNEALSKLISV